MRRLERVPFLRLLFPLLVGIIVQYYFFVNIWSVIPLALGLGMMLFSYFIEKDKEYVLRWMFGCGVYLFLFSVGSVSTMLRQYESEFRFPDIYETYRAVVADIPQEKNETIAYKANLMDSDKKIVCYIPKDTLDSKLSVGDEFVFFSKIQPFKSSGNPEGFDYAHYMYNKGYAGFTFIHSDRWEKTGEVSSDLFIKGYSLREKILNHFQLLGLDKDEYAILSALTLGYKEALSDDLKAAFQTTGTAHLLAVSGMHVGIFYLVIVSLLSFIPKRSRYSRVKPWLTIFFLWFYVFVIGFPPSGVRASCMLTMFCIASMINMREYSLNTFFATAFLMLVWNPFQLFDLGFQLSFSAVLSILLLLPIFKERVQVKSRLLRYCVNIFFVSLAAQVGTLPLCLYYFGTFPTYFFITNILVIPLMVFALYNSLLVLFVVAFSILIPLSIDYWVYIPLFFYKTVITIITEVILFCESLPLAQLKMGIAFFNIFLLWAIIAGSIFFFRKKNAKALIVVLSCCFIWLCSGIYVTVRNKNSLVVYNKKDSMQIEYQMGYTKYKLEGNLDNKLLCLNSVNYFILSENNWREKQTEQKFDVDYLHIAGNNAISLYELNDKFNIKRVILDGSLSGNNLKRFVLECEKLRIPYYDVADNGALRIFFY